MTKQERLIVSAYTGIAMTNLSDYCKFVEEKLGRPILTHELRSQQVQDEIKQAVMIDFLALCEG